MKVRPWALSALVAVLASTAFATAADAAKREPVTVMTRNIYLGGDIMRPLVAVGNQTGAAALISFANANWTLADIALRQTDFPTRAQLLAKEIDDRRPDLIGLQEVALWRTGALELPPDPDFGSPNSTTVTQDFLAILLDAVEDRGLDYEAVVVKPEADVEGPAFLGVPGPNSTFLGSNPRDVRLTMHDVILRRVDRDVKVVRKGSETYDTQFGASLGGATFEFTRGYAWADVIVNERPFRFINTHLESVSSNIALGQASELLEGAARPVGKSTVLLGDFNSDPLNSSVKPTDSVPHYAAYRLLSGDEGGGGTGPYTDEWLQFAPSSDGWTSGFNEFVNDDTTEDIDHRIDLILGRKADGDAIPVDDGWIVGTDQANRSATGLWPSDHAGVVLELRP